MSQVVELESINTSCIRMNIGYHMLHGMIPQLQVAAMIGWIATLQTCESPWPGKAYGGTLWKEHRQYTLDDAVARNHR